MLLKEVPKYETLLAMSRRYPAMDPKAIEACLTLRKVAGDVESAMADHYARHDLSQGRFVAMLMLDQSEDGQATPGELAGMVGVTPATMTGLLRGLEREGLAARQPHAADRRAATIRLTATGQDRLRGMLPEHFRRMSGLMGHLSARECEQFRRLLLKVAAGLPAIADPAPPPPPPPPPPPLPPPNS